MAASTQARWDFQDLVFFLGAILPSLLLGSLLAKPFSANAGHPLIYQSWLYALLFSVLLVLARVRHEQGVADALGWTLDFRGAWLCVLLSPVLAIAISALGAALRAPIIPTPIDQLSNNDIPLPLIIAFATMAGPIFEELIFRGFLQPLIGRAWGDWIGVIVSAAAFSLLHGTQNEWLWQYLVLIFVAGATFGIVRLKTGSTAAAALLHMGFNLTQAVGSLYLRG